MFKKEITVIESIEELFNILKQQEGKLGLQFHGGNIKIIGEHASLYCFSDEFLADNYSLFGKIVNEMAVKLGFYVSF